MNASYKESDAARLLSDGLARAASEWGVSQRTLAKRLGYKQSVVLSHMALGRVPIPLERAAQLADVLLIDKASFLLAVLKQRLPNVDWAAILVSSSSESGDRHLVADLQKIARRPLDELDPGQQAVMREVAGDLHARERWLSIHEVPTLALLRALRPAIGSDGLSIDDRNAIASALTSIPQEEQPPPIF